MAIPIRSGRRYSFTSGCGWTQRWSEGKKEIRPARDMIAVRIGQDARMAVVGAPS